MQGRTARTEVCWTGVCSGGARRTIAIVMAISASVTLSIGELTIGVASFNVRVTCELKSTCRHMRAEGSATPIVW